MRNLLLILLIGFIGCTASLKIDQKTPVKQSTTSAKKTPKDWVLNPPKSSSLFRYAVGSGYDVKEAETVARTQLHNYFQLYIQSATETEVLEVQLNNKNSYIENYSRNISTFTRNNVSGAQVMDTDIYQNETYCLVRLDMQKLDEWQKRYESILYQLIQKAEQETDFTRKLELYIQATSILVKGVYPFTYQDESAFIFLHGRIRGLLDQLKIQPSYKRNKLNDEIDFVVLTLKHQSNPVRQLPISVRNYTALSDSKGTIQLDVKANAIYSNSSLSVRYDLNKIAYPEVLLPPEITNAKELLGNIVGTIQDVTVQFPYLPKVFLQTVVTSSQALNESMIQSALSEIMTQKGIRIVSNSDESNLTVTANIFVNYSSDSVLGICYKTTSTVEILNNGKLVKTITLTDTASEEETKSFADSHQQSAQESLKKMASLIKKKLASIDIQSL